MAGYYYTDGTRIYYTGEAARVQIASEPRCSECGWLYRRVTLADGQCSCRDVLSAEFILEDILDAEVIG